jgi:tRNA(adenine34) deaminase
MSAALDLARHAASLEEIPVAAVIVYHPAGSEPRIIAAGHNQRESQHDPSAHAEIVAMRLAGLHLQSWRLTDCTLYVTLEPCPMCAGALVQARLTRLVYGCRDPKAGAVDSLFQLCSDSRLNHRVEIVSGICAAESARLLQDFFAQRRRAALSQENPEEVPKL